MQAERAIVDQQDWPKGGMALLKTDDGKLFVGKGLYCRKFVLKSNHEQHIEPTWFFNELVYAGLAKRAELNTPENRVLVCKGPEVYFGSEYCTAREPLECEKELRTRFEGDPTQLTRALILDLLLFNNDRTFGKSGDIFSDDQRLYFIDHGHALWGDGRCFGDLHRIESECYNSDIAAAYVSGFLRCTEANEIVWTEENWETVRKEYGRAKRIVIDEFEQTCSDIEKMRDSDLIKHWERQHDILLKPRLVKAMGEALSGWVDYLDEYLGDDSCPGKIRQCLPAKP